MNESISNGGAHQGRALDNPKLKDLETLIRRSFRVRENRTRSRP